MADKTLAEHQVEALSGALRWADGEIEKLRNVIIEIEAMLTMHDCCNPADEACSARDDIKEIVERFRR